MIRVICADISAADDGIYESLYARASHQRRQRADSYRHRADRLRCLTAEALLTSALAVTEEQLEKSGLGKPYIRGRRDVFCNLSHSGRYVVLAWGDTEVGVDVQRHEPKTDTDAIGRRFFTPDERSYAGGDTARFYEIWTKKESYLKYTGKGLSVRLNAFSVLTPDPKLRFFYRMLDREHSLCLCTEEAEYELTLLDIQQLL